SVHHRPRSIHGAARFAFLGVAYVMTFLGVASAPGFAVKLMGSFLLFLIVFHFAMLGHDAGHGSLTRSAGLNRWLGRLALLAAYVPFSSWLANHNALHHAYTNLRGKDPVWAPLSKEEYDA